MFLSLNPRLFATKFWGVLRIFFFKLFVAEMAAAAAVCGTERVAEVSASASAVAFVAFAAAAAERFLAVLALAVSVFLFA